MRIISIDGGGIRGLIPATVLATIERLAGRPIGQLCDLVAGTSTGGIIAAAIGAGIPMDSVRRLYRKQGPQIFSKGLGKQLSSLGGLTDEKYSPDGLERSLQELFGERKLSEASPEILITSCDLAGQPLFFKSRKARQNPVYDYLLRDVCRATSAAPTFFPPAEVMDLGRNLTLNLLDGGLAANNPAMCAITEALRQHMAPLDAVTVLSLGTGFSPTPMTIEQARHCGVLTGGPGILRLVFEGPGHAVNTQCATLLQERYMRLQPVLPQTTAMDATDDPTMAMLEDVARQVTQSPGFDRALNALGIESD